MHAIPQCSEVIDVKSEGYGEKRLCLSCKHSTDQIASIRHEENWRGLNDIWTMNLSILKNGSVMKLKPIKIHVKKLTLNNTCPFDSLFQLVLGTYADRHLFIAQINILATENRRFELIETAAKNGISNQIYKQRAEILYPLFKVSNGNIENQCVLIDCTTVIDKLCAQLLRQTYSLRQRYTCEKCAYSQYRKLHVLSISIDVLKRTDFAQIFEEEVQFTLARCCKFDCDKVVNTTLTSPGKTLRN